jgi:hypothetical protein
MILYACPKDLLWKPGGEMCRQELGNIVLGGTEFFAVKVSYISSEGIKNGWEPAKFIELHFCVQEQ